METEPSDQVLEEMAEQLVRAVLDEAERKQSEESDQVRASEESDRSDQTGKSKENEQSAQTGQIKESKQSDRGAQSAQPQRCELLDIAWGCCGDYTVERGRAQIGEYLRRWEMSPGWRFSVRFVQETELHSEKQLHYTALWSLPTRRAPVPAHTAAVHFTIHIPKTGPPTRPVEVRFLIQPNRTVHTPGKTRVPEKWLRDVIESKALLMDTVDF